MGKGNTIDFARCLAIIHAAENPPPGLKVELYRCSSLFNGSAEELIAAGLAEDGEFPGQPGRGKGSVRYRGIAPPLSEREYVCYAPGFRKIVRYLDRFQLHVNVSREENARRMEAREAEERELRQLQALQAALNTAERQRRMNPVTRESHLRLAWSAPRRGTLTPPSKR